MSQFEFVQVTITVILGLGLTDLLRNFGEQYRHRLDNEVCWLQITASSMLLLFILSYLWNFWLTSNVNWTLPLFLLQVASAGALALSAQFMKIDCSSSKTAKVQYFDNCTAIFVTWAAAPLFAGVFAAVALPDNLPIIRIGIGIVFITLAFVKKPIFHAIIFSMLITILVYGQTVSQLQLN